MVSQVPDSCYQYYSYSSPLGLNKKRLPLNVVKTPLSRPTSPTTALNKMDPNTKTGKQVIQDVYIISAARTPTARANGSFTSIPAPQLGGHAIKDAVRKSNVPLDRISTVYMGNVLQAGVGQSPARQASIFAGLTVSVDAITVNKVCASGLKAVVLAAQDIQLGLAEVQVAGGMENMSRAPYYLARGAMNLWWRC
jgi:acetyl-CoA C-acetyltransferase